MKDENQNEKKSGSPFFILIIFLVLLGFIFIIPDIYKKYHTDISKVLGIPLNSEVQTSNNNSDDEKSIVSDYKQISDNNTLSFNELNINNIKLGNGILSFDIQAKNIDLNNLNYYIEFYQNKSIFLGRRILKGTVNGKEHYELNIKDLNITDDTYFVVSHIEDASIPKFSLETDESGIGTITCKKDDETYTYDFSLDKLMRVEYKYKYASENLDIYSSTLLSYQKLSKTYNNVSGVTSIIAENNNEFIYTLELDYSNVDVFNMITNQYKFKKDEYSYIIKFKMDAEGYKCL